MNCLTILACQHLACLDLAWLVLARRFPWLDLLGLTFFLNGATCLTWLGLFALSYLTLHLLFCRVYFFLRVYPHFKNDLWLGIVMWNAIIWGSQETPFAKNRLVIFGLCSIGLRRHGPFISCHIFLPLCFALSGTHLGSSWMYWSCNHEAETSNLLVREDSSNWYFPEVCWKQHLIPFDCSTQKHEVLNETHTPLENISLNPDDFTPQTAGDFQIFLYFFFSPLPGDMIQFWIIFFFRWVAQPPTTGFFWWYLVMDYFTLYVSSLVYIPKKVGYTSTNLLTLVFPITSQQDTPLVTSSTEGWCLVGAGLSYGPSATLWSRRGPGLGVHYGLMEHIRRFHQLRLVPLCHYLYKVLGPSQVVVWDFFLTSM